MYHFLLWLLVHLKENSLQMLLANRGFPLAPMVDACASMVTVPALSLANNNLP